MKIKREDFVIKTLLLSGASILALGVTSAQAATTVFNYTGGVQYWTAPSTGSYTVNVWGAQGGSGYYSNGGLGAGLGATFQFTAGDHLTLVVGGAGRGRDSGGGGGGASTVIATTPGRPQYGLLIAAGGGGGGGYYHDGSPGRPGVNSGSAGGSGGGAGGTDGYGGAAGHDGGGGGAGFRGAGGAGAGFGGSGMYGGLDGYSHASGGFGGFGGGGGGYYSGGGGGGFSGGGGGSYGGGGGGGGSVIAGANQQVLAYRTGDGEIDIISSAPEPGSWAMLLTGFGFVGYVMRRRLLRAA